MTRDTKAEPEKLELRSLDPAVARREELARLFPEARTEGGKIDFDQLKRALGQTVDAGRERYGLVWPGKAECLKTIQAPSVATLRPAPEEGVNLETTENLIIEGDNLEVLKLLQKSYLGKVKMIYIDPPYNTGNDFIYPDNYAESLQTYLEYTGQVDPEGRKFGTNTEADGRFHSKWLNMMYPRLYLARNLLRDDGAIFITIDDTECSNLRRLCDEIFGEENFVANICWQKVYSPANDKRGIDAMHDYVLCYQRSEAFAVNLLPRTSKQDDAYTNPDSDPRGPWKAVDATRAEHRDYAYYPITTPSGREVYPAQGRSWVFTKEELPGLIKENRLWFGKDGASKPSKKLFLTEVKQGLVPTTWWTHEDAGHNDEAKKELKALVTEELPFDTPKPTRLICRILQIATASKNNDIVLDFFAGSGTTGDATIKQNGADGGNRQFILVQLPEPTSSIKYPSIAEVTKERIRRVGSQMQTTSGQLELRSGAPVDTGFRVFKLAESNFKTWDADKSENAQKLEQQLELHVDHLREGRAAPDFLYEILLKSGFPLTASVEKLSLGGLDVFSVAGGALLICLERKLTLEAIRAMAEKKPERVVCLDEGFAGNDQLKTNAVQTFKAKNVVFRTV